ncbi:glutamate-5-semialdehyde dehydrogenase [uncultured Allobaculum sp.]|uniref:glutamate-5-semialdehyde dehydrogenase n=1 Tax=uncultured Allobaculum sp. TaxID=1187017 RepID=UPI002582CD52|nr:glutamate-5-semialdehyde dehydrogenase [uncultured Allobaculum sp.]
MTDWMNGLGEKAHRAAGILNTLDTNTKNQVLLDAANRLIASTDRILAANAKDLEAARENNMPLPLQDRLMLSAARIESIAQGMREVADLPDPVGSVLEMKKRPNGLLIGKQRVPLGVCAVIYEARPNVTADVFALCFKSGNAVILKGGKEAANSNAAIVEVLQESLAAFDLPMEAASLLKDNSREASRELMRCSRWVDVLIPRGGAGLIASVVENATVPVIETGTGNCHVYVDESADLDMAVRIIINGKTQRVGVCNAVESLLVHRNVVDALLPRLEEKLAEHQVLIHAQKELLPLIDHAKSVEASEEDWGREYLDYEISVKTVNSVDEAIEHINAYNTGHSEAIVTRDYANARKFLNQVDAAAVYVNASTRFTDGHEFGLGAEIGISTQKLHARGPMGLEELTTTKYIIFGDGQIRP